MKFNQILVKTLYKVFYLPNYNNRSSVSILCTPQTKNVYLFHIRLIGLNVVMPIQALAR